MSISSRSRKKIKRLKSKSKPIFLVSLTLLITILLIYVLNLEIPLPYINYANMVISYQHLNTSITLYKIHVSNMQEDVVLNIGAAIKEIDGDIHKEEFYAGLGTHKIYRSAQIIFTNYTSHTILDGKRKYMAYLVINNTYTNIPIAYIDARYHRSFDSIVSYYPYQLHFILKVQKCGIAINLSSFHGLNRIVLKAINEDGSIRKININNIVNRSCFLDICGDRFEVEIYLSPIQLLTIKQTSTRSYLVLGESPLIILLIILVCFVLLVYIFIKNFVKLSTSTNKVI